MSERSGGGILKRFSNMHISTPSSATHNTLAVGVVVDVNDPQQMGRIRVLVEAWNDPPYSTTMDISTIPWATYVSPFSGASVNTPLGPDQLIVPGVLAYGMWNIPKRGAEVIVGCLNGSPGFRMWFGCWTSQYNQNLLPAGSYKPSGGSLMGPLSQSGDAIQPLYDNLSSGYFDRTGFEWASRGVDYSVGVSTNTKSIVGVEADGNNGIRDHAHVDGYATDPYWTGSRQSKVFSWTSPGQHTIFMDDRAENCRIKLRSTTGHQILLDDTNERIHISTNRSKSWVEMDTNGNIDIYAERYLSFHAGKDINFTADGSIRMRGKGLHMLSSEEMRFHSSSDMFIQSDTNIATSTSNLYLYGSTDVNIIAGTNINHSGTNISLIGSSTVVTSAATVGLIGSAQILMTAPIIGENAGAPPAATPAASLTTKLAFSTNRVPFRVDSSGKLTWSHSMLNKSMTDKDSSNLDVSYYSYDFFQFPYEDTANVGMIELEDTIQRGKHWRR